MRALLLSLAAVGIVMGSPAIAQQSDKQAIQAAEEIVAKRTQAIEKKDSVALAATFTEDAMLLPGNGGPPVIGRTEIEKVYAGLFKAGFDHETVIISQGHLIGAAAAWVQGDYAFAGRNQSGESIERKGHWMDVIVRDGSDWKVRVLSANTTLPPPVASGSSTTNK